MFKGDIAGIMIQEDDISAGTDNDAVFRAAADNIGFTSGINGNIFHRTICHIHISAVIDGNAVSSHIAAVKSQIAAVIDGCIRKDRIVRSRKDPCAVQVT